MPKSPYEILLNYSFWLLGKKSYSVAELGRRLNRRAKNLSQPRLPVPFKGRKSFRFLPDPEEFKREAPEAIQKVMARLKELKYLDDGKILENYFDYRLTARPQGKFLFLNEMRKKGISLDEAKKAWERRGISEEELALTFLKSREKKLSGLSGALRKKKAAALLASRGFAPDTVWKIIDKL